MIEDERPKVEDTCEGIPRNKISWYPIVDCGKCIDYCVFGVYEFEEKAGEKRSVVKNPYNCTPVFCRGCEEICTAGAITHQSEEETQKIIDKLKQSLKRERQ
jgi:NAD-dependent dihydropyrimidine dehydrogenase PreA subunit